MDNLQNRNNKLKIRNSTAEFLIFACQSQGDDVEVRVQSMVQFSYRKKYEITV